MLFRNVRYRLADLTSCHTRYTHPRHVVPSVGEVDTVVKVAQSRRRPNRWSMRQKFYCAQFCAYPQTLPTMTNCDANARNPCWERSSEQFITIRPTPCKSLNVRSVITQNPPVLGTLGVRLPLRAPALLRLRSGFRQRTPSLAFARLHAR